MCQMSSIYYVRRTHSDDRSGQFERTRVIILIINAESVQGEIRPLEGLPALSIVVSNESLEVVNNVCY